MAVSDCKGVRFGEDTLGFTTVVISWPEILRRAGSPGRARRSLGHELGRLRDA